MLRDVRLPCRRTGGIGIFALCFASISACGPSDDEPRPTPEEWSTIHQDLDAALISIWGTQEDDVWAVGADAGSGPLVIHWNGSGWRRFDTGVEADLYWVFGFANGPVYFGGTSGTILRYEDGAFARLNTPGTGTVFGIWGTSREDVWAVGGAEGGSDGAFAWRLAGDEWAPAAGFPSELGADKALWKVWGRSPEDVWLVGTSGTAVHFDGEAFTPANLGGGESLFTVHYANGKFAAVGGFATGLVFEHDGTDWARVDSAGFPALIGVCLTQDGGYAVGSFGGFVERANGSWHEAKGPSTSEALHAIWIDPAGGLWTVGGQVQVRPLVRGLLAYRGERAPLGDIE